MTLLSCFSRWSKVVLHYVVVIGLSTLVVANVVVAFTEPSLPPPQGTTVAPLNIGSFSQTKTGDLTIHNMTSSARLEADIMLAQGLRVFSHAFLATDSGNVGIGDIGPDALLEVSASGGASTLFMLSSDDANDGNRLIVTNAGNVGIGTPSAVSKLTIGQTDGVNEGAEIRFLGAGANRYFYLDNFAGTLRLISQDASGESVKFVIGNDGAVGIGTTSPFRTLSVAGTIHASGDVCIDQGGKCLSSISGGGGIQTVGSMSQPVVFANPSADDQWLGLGATNGRIEFDRVQGIDEVNILNAKFGIGTTSPERLLSVDSVGGNSAHFTGSVHIGGIGRGPLTSLKLLVEGAVGVRNDMYVGGKTFTLGGLIIENRVGNPSSPESGRLWLDTSVPVPSPGASGKNFFLLSFNQYDGDLLGYATTNLGYTGTVGIQAADKICLNEVNSNNFIGKLAGKTYAQGEVYAFLCGNTGCNNLLPGVAYIMGRLGTTRGGHSFTTTATPGMFFQTGPNDNFDWSTLNGFDLIASYWTGRSWFNETMWTTSFGVASCLNWVTKSGHTGVTGHSYFSDRKRWSYDFMPHGESCDLSKKLICVVDSN